MARSAARFTKLDVTRALKGAQDAGIEPKAVRIEPAGAIIVAFTEPAPATAGANNGANEWDEVLEK
jgi:hypothetical protein